MFELREIKTRKERKDFLDFPLKLYKDCPYYVPALYMDEAKIFTTKNTYHDQCDDKFFGVYENGKMVGRVHAILQKVANEKWGQKRVRFTRYDLIDNQEVSDMLLGAVEAWAKELGMEEVVGPLGYSDLEREGLLIDGFDQVATFEESYNYPYYQKLLENYGYGKDVDWNESYLRRPKDLNPKIKDVSEKMMKKYNLHFGQAKNTNDFLNKYADGFFEILDETYNHIYGTVPFSPAMKKMMIDNFKLIINIKYVSVILDENDKIVCFGLCFPAIGKPMQKHGGHLTLPCLIETLKTLKHPEVIDLALIGVLPEYASKGIATAIINHLMLLFDMGVEHLETNLNLEDNFAIQNCWKHFDRTIHKHRRCYKKAI